MRGQPSGVAMANPHDSAATIAFFFTDSDGIDSRHSTFTLGAREQMARFLNEDPFNGGDGRWCMNRNWPATNPTHRSITYQERTTMAYRARPSG